MKQNVTNHDFHNAFKTLRPDNFTYGGLSAMFEHLEELENDIGEELELNVIAICCDFAQFNIKELEFEYSHITDPHNPLKTMEDWIEFLSEYTTVIPVTDTDYSKGINNPPITESLIVSAF